MDPSVVPGQRDGTSSRAPEASSSREAERSQSLTPRPFEIRSRSGEAAERQTRGGTHIHIHNPPESSRPGGGQGAPIDDHSGNRLPSRPRDGQGAPIGIPPFNRLRWDLPDAELPGERLGETGQSRNRNRQSRDRVGAPFPEPPETDTESWSGPANQGPWAYDPVTGRRRDSAAYNPFSRRDGFGGGYPQPPSMPFGSLGSGYPSAAGGWGQMVPYGYPFTPYGQPGFGGGGMPPPNPYMYPPPPHQPMRQPQQSSAPTDSWPEFSSVKAERARYEKEIEKNKEEAAKAKEMFEKSETELRKREAELRKKEAEDEANVALSKVKELEDRLKRETEDARKIRMEEHRLELERRALEERLLRAERELKERIENEKKSEEHRRRIEREERASLEREIRRKIREEMKTEEDKRMIEEERRLRLERQIRNELLAERKREEEHVLKQGEKKRQVEREIMDKIEEARRREEELAMYKEKVKQEAEVEVAAKLALERQKLEVAKLGLELGKHPGEAIKILLSSAPSPEPKYPARVEQMREGSKPETSPQSPQRLSRASWRSQTPRSFSQPIQGPAAPKPARAATAQGPYLRPTVFDFQLSDDVRSEVGLSQSGFDDLPGAGRTFSPEGRASQAQFRVKPGWEFLSAQASVLGDGKERQSIQPGERLRWPGPSDQTQPPDHMHSARTPRGEPQQPLGDKTQPFGQQPVQQPPVSRGVRRRRAKRSESAKSAVESEPSEATISRRRSGRNTHFPTESINAEFSSLLGRMTGPGNPVMQANQTNHRHWIGVGTGPVNTDSGRTEPAAESLGFAGGAESDQQPQTRLNQPSNGSQVVDADADEEEDSDAASYTTATSVPDVDNTRLGEHNGEVREVGEGASDAEPEVDDSHTSSGKEGAPSVRSSDSQVVNEQGDQEMSGGGTKEPQLFTTTTNEPRSGSSTSQTASMTDDDRRQPSQSRPVSREDHQSERTEPIVSEAPTSATSKVSTASMVSLASMDSTNSSAQGGDGGGRGRGKRSRKRRNNKPTVSAQFVHLPDEEDVSASAVRDFRFVEAPEPPAGAGLPRNAEVRKELRRHQNQGRRHRPPTQQQQQRYQQQQPQSQPQQGRGRISEVHGSAANSGSSTQGQMVSHTTRPVGTVHIGMWHPEPIRSLSLSARPTPQGSPKIGSNA